MTDSLRLGIVGCGAVTLQSHLPALLATPEARLVSLVDTDLDWARDLAAKARSPHAGVDYRDLEGRVDAAIVATPVSTHAAIACDLLERGIHVLCEKPAAANSPDVERMFATARRTGRKLLIGQSKRFSPTLGFLSELFERGWLEPDGHLEASFGGLIGRWPARTDYRGKPELAGGGALIDQGIHLIDLAVWLLGNEATEVEYEATGSAAGLELDAEVRLRFAGGGSAHLAASHSRGLSAAVTYTAASGWVRTKLFGNQVDFYLEGARACRLGGMQQPVLEGQNTIQQFARQLGHFCHAVLHDRPLLVTDAQAIAVLRIVERCYGAANPTAPAEGA